MSISKDVKCVVVGDVLIGKTTLLLKITTGEYPSFCYPTVFENYILDARLIRGTRVVLSFFDTCKSRSFLFIATNYMKGLCSWLRGLR